MIPLWLKKNRNQRARVDGLMRGRGGRLIRRVTEVSRKSWAYLREPCTWRGGGGGL